MTKAVKAWLLRKARQDLAEAEYEAKEDADAVREYVRRVEDPTWSYDKSVGTKSVWYQELRSARTRAKKSAAKEREMRQVVRDLGGTP